MNYCLIPDDSAAFWEFLSGLPLPAGVLQALRKSTIEKVEIQEEPPQWRVYVKTVLPISEAALQPVAEALCRQCGLDKVAFFLQQPQLALAPRRDKPLDKQSVMAALERQEPASVRFLAQALWQWEEQQLTLEMPGDMVRDYLLEQGLDERLSALLAAMSGQPWRVLMTSAPAGEPACETDDEQWQTEAYRAAQLAVAAESMQEATKGKTPLLFGKRLRGEPRPLMEIQEEENKVTVQGTIFNLESRVLKSGKTLVTFEIADDTDGISCKVFFEEAQEADRVLKKLANGQTAQVCGDVKHDKFNDYELILFAEALMLTEKEVRQDAAEVKRVELHAHTRMSSMDSVVPVKDFIKRAAKWGHPAVAITDHGVVQAFPEAYETAEKCGIKLIYGLEGYLFDDNINESWHIVILAKSLVGLHNMYRLVSLSHLQYFHRKPRIPRFLLEQYREGLVLGSACEAGELYQALLEGEPEEKVRQIARFYDYLEIQPTGNNAFLIRQGKVAGEKALEDLNRRICALGEELQLPVVATCDVHFLDERDEVYRRVLMGGQGYSDADLQPPVFFRTTEEMLAAFAYLGQQKAYEVVVENPRSIAEAMEAFKPIPDELYSPEIPGAEEDIYNMSYDNARRLYGDELPQLVQDRLTMELNSIINNGFAVLYLIAHKLVKKSLDDGYLVGSRGSVGSSFVATMTDITEVNPLPPHWRCDICRHSEFVLDGSAGSGFDLPDKDCPHCHQPMVRDGHDIPFAVFLGFHGDKVPDIDLNFSGEYQPVAHKYTEELFGRDNVFRAGTIATIADKTAFGFVSKYFEGKGIKCRQARINGLVPGCTGVKRTTGQHPGGIMVVPRNMDVHFFTPIQYPADDKNATTVTTHFDYHSISSRLVKLDILGHDDPTVIKMLEDITQIPPRSIPIADQATMSLFSSTEALGVSPKELGSTVGTYGIPEFGTKFVRQMLEDIKPTGFSELVRVSGFSHGTDVWLNNAQDLIRSGTAKVSETISARDDIMVYLIQKGLEPGLAFKIMESVRKGKGVNPDQCTAMRAKNVPEWYIESCQKIKYMFPKAHAVAYVLMAYRIAYCKVHHPLAFYAAYFSIRADDFDADLIVQGKDVIKSRLRELEQLGNKASVKEKSLQTILEVALEMYLRGYCLHSIDLYKSDPIRFQVLEDGLLPPLSALQGVGDNAAKNIAEARVQREFLSIDDLRTRSHVSKTIIELLRGHGCLAGLPESDQLALFG